MARGETVLSAIAEDVSDFLASIPSHPAPVSFVPASAPKQQQVTSSMDDGNHDIRHRDDRRPSRSEEHSRAQSRASSAFSTTLEQEEEYEQQRIASIQAELNQSFIRVNPFIILIRFFMLNNFLVVTVYFCFLFCFFMYSFFALTNYSYIFLLCIKYFISWSF